MTKRKVADVLWLAFQYAKSDRQSYIEAWGNNTKEQAVRDAIADIKAIEELQKKIFGTTQSRLEASMLKMSSFDILGMIARGENVADEIPHIKGE